MLLLLPGYQSCSAADIAGTAVAASVDTFAAFADVADVAAGVEDVAAYLARRW